MDYSWEMTIAPILKEYNDGNFNQITDEEYTSITYWEFLERYCYTESITYLLVQILLLFFIKIIVCNVFLYK